MDKDLVEKITRLVIERMNIDSSASSSSQSLSEAEIKDWQALHLGHRMGSSTYSKKTGSYLTPLSGEELEDWEGLSLMTNFNAHPSKLNETKLGSNKVRFSNYY